MNVVTRSLLSTGLAMYAGFHVFQATGPPAGAPTWLRLAFVATGIVAAVLAVLVLVGRSPLTTWMNLSALLTGSSMLALAASFTIGFFGVTETDIRLSTIGAVIAEAVVLVSWAADRAGGPEVDEVDEHVPSLPWGSWRR